MKALAWLGGAVLLIALGVWLLPAIPAWVVVVNAAKAPVGLLGLVVALLVTGYAATVFTLALGSYRNEVTRGAERQRIASGTEAALRTQVEAAERELGRIKSEADARLAEYHHWIEQLASVEPAFRNPTLLDTAAVKEWYVSRGAHLAIKHATTMLGEIREVLARNRRASGSGGSVETGAERDMRERHQALAYRALGYDAMLAKVLESDQRITATLFLGWLRLYRALFDELVSMHEGHPISIRVLTWFGEWRAAHSNLYQGCTKLCYEPTFAPVRDEVLGHVMAMDENRVISPEN